MNRNKYIAAMLASVLLSNAAGYLLKVNGLERYIILLGFRLHLSLLLPFLTILPFVKKLDISGIFRDVPNGKYYMPLIWTLFPLAITIVAPFFAGIIEFNDPDYFYEFGLSSLLDYPVYMFWNLPQFLAIGFFIAAGKKIMNLNAFAITAFLAALFVYEFIPSSGARYDLITPACFLVAVVPASFVLSAFRNVYLFSLLVFSEVWCGVLAFGSSSKMIINIFLAAQYSSWDGFFLVNKVYSDYAVLIFFAISMAVILFSTAIAGREK